MCYGTVDASQPGAGLAGVGGAASGARPQRRRAVRRNRPEQGALSEFDDLARVDPLGAQLFGTGGGVGIPVAGARALPPGAGGLASATRTFGSEGAARTAGAPSEILSEPGRSQGPAGQGPPASGVGRPGLLQPSDIPYPTILVGGGGAGGVAAEAGGLAAASALSIISDVQQGVLANATNEELLAIDFINEVPEGENPAGTATQWLVGRDPSLPPVFELDDPRVQVFLDAAQPGNERNAVRGLLSLYEQALRPLGDTDRAIEILYGSRTLTELLPDPEPPPPQGRPGGGAIPPDPDDQGAGIVDPTRQLQPLVRRRR